MSLEPKTILFVEDERAIRKLISTILKRAGYRVLEASDAGEAEVIWTRENSGIDLLLTDIAMPGLSGPELARDLLAERPALKVLFASGNSEHLPPHIAILLGQARVLQKPYAPKQLLEAVADALQEP